MRAGDRPAVWTTEGELDLAVVLDLYARTVIGWAMSPRLTVDRAERTLTLARTHRTPLAGWLHHSDRGRPYAARCDPRLLGEHGITSRLSRTGHGWDKAGVDSCVGTLTRELVSPRRDAIRHEATQDIVESIEVVSNRGRRHSTLGYDSPAEFEARTAVA